MDKHRLSVGVLGMALLVASAPGVALAQDDATDTLTPEDIDWTLTTMAGSAVPADVEVTLRLSGGEVVGNAGCNSYFGSYELDGDALTFSSPLGVTRKLCEGTAQEVEDSYLPLLEANAGWSIDEANVLSLIDGDGAVQLVYSELPVEITASDVDALVATLGDLQAQIDEAVAEVAALEERAASVNVNKFDKRLTATEESVKKLETKTEGLNVEGLKKRISALETTTEAQQAQIAEINKTINKLRNRIKVLEASDQEQAAQIAALEAAVLVPNPADG
jgi:heat shock protein HslJ